VSLNATIYDPGTRRLQPAKARLVYVSSSNHFAGKKERACTVNRLLKTHFAMDIETV